MITGDAFSFEELELLVFFLTGVFGSVDLSLLLLDDTFFHPDLLGSGGSLGVVLM